jgi:tRNA pseudouridine38-40 synthase
MGNYRLTLCYDGTRWKGWQKQGNTDNTIQGKLENLLSRLLDQPVEVNGSGRTDAGTHAKGQVASFRAKTHMTTDEILAGLRQYLPADIGAISLEEAEPRFHARLSCTGKTYVYTKTMYELNRAYGWTKFIVVVPETTIREGVFKSFGRPSSTSSSSMASASR